MVEKLKIKDQGPSKQKYSNQRREKAKITSKEATTYIVQLLRKKNKKRGIFLLLIFLVRFEASMRSFEFFLSVQLHSKIS